MSKIAHYILIIGISLLSLNTFSQLGTTEITGVIQDEITSEPLPFAKVVLHSKLTDKVLTGVLTKDLGDFSIQTDSTNFYLRISAIGYEDVEFTDLDYTKNTIDLGHIKMPSITQGLDEVKVVAEKSSMEFKLDKRVFNVGKDIGSTGAGALDVLNNVPSVSVDIEGNIKLRGNDGVQILINGKPSVLSDEASNALGTITADMIESIELITNPSAKYDASGTSGIINIILKKDESKGINGSISVNTGWPHNHSIGGSLNYRTKKLNLFTQFGAGYRSLPSYNESENINRITGSSVISEGTAYRNENFYNITLGSDFYINDYNTLTLSGNFAYEIESQPSSTSLSIYDSLGNLSSRYERTEVTSALNPKYQYDFQYKKEFKNNKEHVLQFSALGKYFGKEQSSEFDNNYTTGTQLYTDQETNTNFYQANQTYQLDYVNPITKKITLELGSMYDINNVGNNYEVYNNSGGISVLDTSLTNDFKYNQKVLAGYITTSYESKKWGVKAGVRVENTDLETRLTQTNTENNMNYTNVFPTFHTSYKISKAFQLQAGYSKRIFRPRLWDLNPFFNIKDNYNIRTGNPDLLPEFADSYEITGIFIFKEFSLNTSVYYLHTTDVKENIAIYEDGVTITKPANIGTRDKVGGELNWKYPVAKWFTMNGDVNYGYFQRTGSFESQNFDFTGNQWSGKLNLKFKLKADIDIETSVSYESAYKTVQGNVAGFAYADAGIRKKLLKGKAVVNLSVRDIFAYRKRESFVDQPTYYYHSYSNRGRFVTFGFSYSFGKGEAMSYTGGGRR